MCKKRFLVGWVREKRLVTANGCGDLEESGGNVLKFTVVMAAQLCESTEWYALNEL